MDAMMAQCAAQSVGPANQLFGLLIQTILAAQCAISPPSLWPEDYGEKLSAEDQNEYDFIVIGSGSAGSVVASRLSENPDWKVLLLEAGENPKSESEIPMLCTGLQRTSQDWDFYAESDSACQGYSYGCHWPRGKTLGGSSAINAMFYVRGTPRDYNRWAELGNPTWDYETVLKYMKKSEGHQNPNLVQYQNGRYHSDKGPLLVDYNGKELNNFSKMFIEAGEERGIKYVNDINADELLGMTHVTATIVNGRRQSAAKAFLVPAKNRTNLHIIKHAHVQKILIDDNNVATGVEFMYKDKQIHKATIRKEVILSAGAVSSPQLLMLSGIGPKEHLKEHNIKVKHDAPGVGKNLFDHVYTPIYFQFHRSTAVKESLVQILDEIYNLAIHNSGPLTTLDISQLLAMINTVNGTGEPDVQIHILTSDRDSIKFKSHVKEREFSDDVSLTLLKANEEAEIATFWVVLLQPRSSGYIELKSSSPNEKPRIVPNYFSDEEDMNTMIRAMNQSLAFTETETYRKHEGEFVRLPVKECDEFEFKSNNYWRCYIRQFSSTLYHPVGTSKMGDRDPEAVVDSRLNVRGVKRLRQADAGIMPELVSANTNAACIMIGERAADFIKEDYHKEPKTEL